MNKDFIRHYQHGEEELTPSLSELHDKNPRAAREQLRKLVNMGRRDMNYMKKRKKVERWLHTEAKRLGIKPETKYPLYATHSSALPDWKDEKYIDFKVPKKVTFTLGDSFPSHYQKKAVLTYKQLKDVLKNKKIDLATGKSKHGYIEAQVWDKNELKKTAFWNGFEKRAMGKNIIDKLLRYADDPSKYVMVQGERGRITNDNPEEFKKELLKLKGKEDFDWSVTGRESDFSSTYETLKD